MTLFPVWICVDSINVLLRIGHSQTARLWTFVWLVTWWQQYDDVIDARHSREPCENQQHFCNVRYAHITVVVQHSVDDVPGSDVTCDMMTCDVNLRFDGRDVCPLRQASPRRLWQCTQQCSFQPDSKISDTVHSFIDGTTEREAN